MSEKENARAQREARQGAVSRARTHPADTLAERAIRHYVLAEEVSRKRRATESEEHEKPGEGER
jgi:hypothetical protein